MAHENPNLNFTKKYEEFGFEITVWFCGIRGEYYVWNYTIKDEDGVRDPEKIREYFWSTATSEPSLEQISDRITDFHSMVG